MGSRWRALFDRFLPWYNSQGEQIRNARTERIAKRSIASRAQAERVIAEYREAEETADVKAEAVIDEARR